MPFCYLSTGLDAYTRQILSHVLGESPKVDVVLATTKQLILSRVIDLSAETLIHSDRGCHYTSHKFMDIVKGRPPLINVSPRRLLGYPFYFTVPGESRCPAVVPGGDRLRPAK